MTSSNSLQPRLRLYFFLIALIVGLIPTFLLDKIMDSDGIPYLDIGDAVFHGDFNALVNGVWSPVYAVIVGFFLNIFKPGFEHECLLIHFVNYFIFIVAFFCFDFFLSELIKFQKQKDEWALLVLGYSLFIWSSVNLITLSITSPDLCVSAVVFLLTGILLKINSGKAKWGSFVLFGLILGLGYLTKTAMFLIAFIFLGMYVFIASKYKNSFFRLFVTFLVFCLVSSPFIYFLSKSRGRFTYGETAYVNYHWHTNYNACDCFDNDSPACGGKLTHPMKVIFSKPRVYEYSTPFNVTYPVPYDFSYWCEGINTHFDLKGQIRAIWVNMQIYYQMFFYLQPVLIITFFVLLFVSNRKWLFLNDMWENKILLLPAILGMGLYALVHVEERYVSSFIVPFWLGLFSALKLPDSKEIKKLLSSSILVLTTILIILSVFSKDLMDNRILSLENKINWQVASHFKNIGMKEGDKVGVVGIYDDYYWARLARLRIIAEIPSEEEIINFWTSDKNIKSQVLNAFRNAGAKMLVAGRAPEVASRDGWKNIEDTPYYYYVL